MGIKNFAPVILLSISLFDSIFSTEQTDTRILMYITVLCCSDEESPKFSRDDHDEFNEAGEQGETECESRGKWQFIQSKSTVQSEVFFSFW